MKHSHVGGGACWVFVSEKQHQERYSGYDTPSWDQIPPSFFSFFPFLAQRDKRGASFTATSMKNLDPNTNRRSFRTHSVVYLRGCDSPFWPSGSQFVFVVPLSDSPSAENSALHSSPLPCNIPKPLWSSLCDTCFSPHLPTDKLCPWPDGSSLGLFSLVYRPLTVCTPIPYLQNPVDSDYTPQYI